MKQQGTSKKEVNMESRKAIVAKLIAGYVYKAVFKGDKTAKHAAFAAEVNKYFEEAKRDALYVSYGACARSKYIAEKILVEGVMEFYHITMRQLRNFLNTTTAEHTRNSGLRRASAKLHYVIFRGINTEAEAIVRKYLPDKYVPALDDVEESDALEQPASASDGNSASVVLVDNETDGSEDDRDDDILDNISFDFDEADSDDELVDAPALSDDDAIQFVRANILVQIAGSVFSFNGKHAAIAEHMRALYYTCDDELVERFHFVSDENFGRYVNASDFVIRNVYRSLSFAAGGKKALQNLLDPTAMSERWQKEHRDDIAIVTDCLVYSLTDDKLRHLVACIKGGVYNAVEVRSELNLQAAADNDGSTDDPVATLDTPKDSVDDADDVDEFEPPITLDFDSVVDELGYAIDAIGRVRASYNEGDCSNADREACRRWLKGISDVIDSVARRLNHS